MSRTFLTLLLLAASSYARAADLSGRVVADDDDGPVEGAHVVIEGTEFHWFTDANGAFSFSTLAPGAYNLTVTREGFQTFRDRIEVSEGAATTLEIRLPRELTLQESVSVAYRTRPRTTEVIDFLVGNEAFEIHPGGS